MLLADVFRILSKLLIGSAKQITIVNHFTIIVSLLGIFSIFSRIIKINEITMVFVSATTLPRPTKISSLALLVTLHTCIAIRARWATRSFVHPITISSVIWSFRRIVLSTWLVQQLVRVIVVIIFHSFLHFFLKCPFEPFASWLLFVCLVNLILMFVLYVSYKRFHCLKLLRTEGAHIANTGLSLNFFSLRAAIIFQIILVELFLRIDILLWPLLNSFERLLHVFCHEGDASAVVWAAHTQHGIQINNPFEE